MHFLDLTYKSIIGDNDCTKSIIGDNDCTELRGLLMLMIVRIVDFVCVSINQYPQYFGRFYISSYLRDGQSYKSLCCSHVVHLFTVRRRKTFLIHYSKKTVLILYLFHLFIKSIHW